MEFGRAGDGNDPCLLREQPSERNLGGHCFFLLSKFANQVDQGLIGFAIFRSEARDNVTEIIFVKLRVLADLARKEPFSERTKRNEADTQLLKCGEHFGFRLSPPKGVVALKRRN